jgi:phenylacetate-coenzyme A ligase PaaK-like adenylate-forming protein
LNFNNRIFGISATAEFNDLALEVFNHQYENVDIYHRYVDLYYNNKPQFMTVNDIPFLPIEFFKSHKIIENNVKEECIFGSSGTTDTRQSFHYIKDLSVYERSFKTGVNLFYKDISEYCILALLPSYLGRNDSSLVYMVQQLINSSQCKESKFYLNNLEELYQTLSNLREKNKKTILIGVSFALLDFAEKYQCDFPELIVMETGGMKGKRKEMVREEMHAFLEKRFGVNSIHSEYGMTELLSQAYSKGNGIFYCPPWMSLFARDPNDPVSISSKNKKGCLNIIDLANYNSCSFIATDDYGKVNADGSFEVLGRVDNSDIRGCNLMTE